REVASIHGIETDHKLACRSGDALAQEQVQAVRKEDVLKALGEASRKLREKQLSSWAGMCPGNEESAGKHRRRRITPGNRWLKQTLAQAAWAASHTKNAYLASQYRRLAGHRGKKRALIAVGHSMLVIFYHTMQSGASYAELGGDFFDPRT